MAALIGKTLGNYRVLEQLGRGGMAAVYKAYQPSLERYVAIKVIHEQLVTQDAQFFKRFQREAKVVASLHHPNIVPVFDFGVEGDIPYMVMEYLEGRSLKAELRELSGRGETMPPQEIVRIVGDVAGAVDYAYHQGIVHHDLKPDNVMLTTKGETILTDFGIAKIAGGTQVTVSGAVMGTPTYMSPEQGKGERGDQRSDVYSLGVILYEMVTGRVPFEADTPLAVIFKHISDPLPLPRSLNPGVPERVEQVILKALAKAPEDRFQSTALMARALEQAIPADLAVAERQPLADELTSAEAVIPP
jgi:serine/threonine protein kinase